MVPDTGNRPEQEKPAKLHLETRVVHAGGEPDSSTGALAPPLHLSTTFEHGPAAETPGGYLYVRHGSPTETRLEKALADLEGGEEAIVFASGMAAGAAVLQTLPPGSHVVLHTDVYYDIHRIAREYFPRWGMKATVADLKDPVALSAAVCPDTRAVWIETPSNPLLEVLDIARLAQLAHETGAELIVDGTFATPVLQRPLELGADVVLHSTTKYMGGHSDVQGGALIFRLAGERSQRVRKIRQVLGSVASPFNSWLILRGLRTLACRVERQAATALAVAEALESHPAVKAVHYPGLPSHPGHDVARHQMSGYGAVLSFRVRGGLSGALRCASRVRLFVNATSLGGVESILEHRASVQGPDSPVPDDLLRLSVGLEHPGDLIADLRQALA